MIAIIDYEAGNLTSVELAIRHIGGESTVTKNPQDIRDAERIIFPGVGSAAACMANLRRLGFETALKEAVESGKPVLAICIGLQLLFESSEEDGGVDCLGILPGKVRKFSFPSEKHVKIPHMGWNSASQLNHHPLYEGIADNAEFYFVHSYYTEPSDSSLKYGGCEYSGFNFCCAAARDNLFATQYHPEKSGEAGLQLLSNFLGWNGKT